MAENKPKLSKPVVKKEKEIKFLWEGLDKKNKRVNGEQFAISDTVIKTSLRNRGIKVIKIKKQKFKSGKKISAQDVTLFTRQLSTMMRAGVPLLQSFEIVANGNANPRVGKLLNDIKTSVETGSSLEQSFKQHPDYFDDLFCNLVGAGEQAGILDTILDRLATYQEKTLAIKSKIKSAMFYPISVMVVAGAVVTVIMIFVVPAFKQVFESFGATLPLPTQIVMNVSEFFVKNWYIGAALIFFGINLFRRAYKKSKSFRDFLDRFILKVPVFGDLIEKSSIARWTRTLATMFSAGVPLVESLSSVAGAAGNVVFYDATKKIQNKVATGSSLTTSMQESGVFSNMVIQMTQIGEESGSLDTMLNKVADFYEAEVDDAVAALSSLLEPMIIVFLGVVIGGLVVAMYLPIFKLGAVV